MNRRAFLATLASSTTMRGLAQRSERPDVILVMTDDQGWWDLGVYGNRYVESPTIDKLAAEGVRFTHFYCSPVCSPTRASFMTGRHYQRSGGFDTYMGRQALQLDEVTLGDLFKSQGYRTAIVGKWHLGDSGDYHPNSRGFDEAFGLGGFVPRLNSPVIHHNRNRVSVTGYITDILTDQAIGFLEREHENPFFLFLSHTAVHSPFEVPDHYIEKYLKKGLPLRTSRIYGMVTNIDENTRRLLDTVDRLGLRENTVIVFMSDNGGVSRYFQAGLRGNKGSVYEGGVRVPFIARWPGEFPAGAVVDAAAQHIDLLPTLSELIGAPLPPDREIDGKSILSLLAKGEGESPHDYIFHQWNRVRPIMEPPGEIPGTFPPIDRRGFKPNWAVRDRQGYKYVVSDQDPGGALYDLRSDPGEKNNVADEHPKIAVKLREEFKNWFKDVTAGQDYSVLPVEVGRPDENPVKLDILAAQASGKRVQAVYHPGGASAIENWTESGDVIAWDLRAVRSGRYEFTLSYGCNPGDGGARIRVSAGGSSFEYIVQETAADNVFQKFTVGTLDLVKGPVKLKLKALEIPGKQAMQLRNIWVERIG